MFLIRSRVVAGVHLVWHLMSVVGQVASSEIRPFLFTNSVANVAAARVKMLMEFPLDKSNSKLHKCIILYSHGQQLFFLEILSLLV